MQQRPTSANWNQWTSQCTKELLPTEFHRTITIRVNSTKSVGEFLSSDLTEIIPRLRTKRTTKERPMPINSPCQQAASRALVRYWRDLRLLILQELLWGREMHQLYRLNNSTKCKLFNKTHIILLPPRLPSLSIKRNKLSLWSHKRSWSKWLS